ncbi:MAG: hypothetical protein AAGM67_05245 [Bacteroidota bacterium]
MDLKTTDSNGDVMERRRPKAEREVASRATEALRMLNRLKPHNPADTKQAWEMYLACRENLGKIADALSSVVCGPHADIDYIEDAMDDLDTVFEYLEEGNDQE